MGRWENLTMVESCLGSTEDESWQERSAEDPVTAIAIKMPNEIQCK